MDDQEFAARVPEMIVAAAEMIGGRIRGLIRSARVSAECTDYTDSYGGVSLWTITLDIALPTYVEWQADREDAENRIRTSFEPLMRRYPGHAVRAVQIHPLPQDAAPVPDPDAVARVWSRPGFRLFLSHVSAHRVAVEQLKGALEPFGVSAFVAHTDIEPSQPWLAEIEAALGSMEALAAILTPGFAESHWTDQEVGWAMGRDVPVLAVQCGLQPYGFVGKWQSVPGGLKDASALAERIAAVSVRWEAPRAAMRPAAVRRLAEAYNFAAAKQCASWLKKFTGFTSEEKETLRRACRENSQVREATGVPGIVRELIGEAPPRPVELPPADEDIPF